MANIYALQIYHKIFCFYLKFPIAYNQSTGKFFVCADKDLFYSFYIAECIIISGFVANVAEVIHIAYSEKIEILPVILDIINVSLMTFDVLTAVAAWLWKHEGVAFLNDLVRHVDELGKGGCNQSLPIYLNLA